MKKAHPATQAQVIATNPAHSTWLSANAGSGKTRVLTDRVALLLLNGVDPQNILCLTYTKAAASEMQNRLFKRLGAWAMMSDADLRKELALIHSDDMPLPGDLHRARTLFAEAIETPGGLRIQTIHSFCAALLRRFPLEAGVSPLFQEMDDRQALELRNEILDSMATGEAREELSELALILRDEDFGKVIEQITRNRHQFLADFQPSAVFERFGLKGENDLSEQTRQILSGAALDTLAALISALAAGTPTDQKKGAALETLNKDHPRQADRDLLYTTFLYASAPHAPKFEKLCTTQVRERDPALFDAVDDLALKVETLRKVEKATVSAKHTITLHRFALAYLAAYDEGKLRKGWLDFDDLISKTEKLLTDHSVADWVMYRLDGGIDHILVDEAQDTSPVQWRVIKLLAREFGQEQEDARRRTLFVVGDKKQSIYSFQGADPEEFDRMLAYFSDKLSIAGQDVRSLPLTYSFRSAPAILDFVDTVFNEIDTGGFAGISHQAFHSTRAGRVDLWPLAPKPKKPEPKPWYDTSFVEREENENVALAEAIADHIEHTLSHETLETSDGQRRPVHAGDILILVQQRSALFEELLRACKSRNLELAGADRLKLRAELAVNDLIALLCFLALPADSLSLAVALRSPIFGLSEQDLFSLAHNRGDRDLWSSLQENQHLYPEAVAALGDLLRKADFLAPYELLERILSNFGARVRILERLGAEAEEGIDELLMLAQGFDATAPASLTSFLVWLEQDETEIKRQIEGAGQKIRIMTTHGAKGLEAPIVYLPETRKIDGGRNSSMIMDRDGFPLWKANAPMSTEHQQKAQEHLRQKVEQEKLRLFYVAMTRAEQWLIICGAGESAKEGSWYNHARDAICRVPSRELETQFGTGFRFETNAWPETQTLPESEEIAPSLSLPDWAISRAQAYAEPLTALNPSRLPGAKTLPSEQETEDPETAALRGTAVHLLLEFGVDFSSATFEIQAHALLEAKRVTLSDEDKARVIAEAQLVLGNPELAWIFAPGSLSEVAISAPANVPNHDRIFGTIDRLIVSDDVVTIIDFKTNAILPKDVADVPDGLLDQLAVYVTAIRKIYPDRRIDAAILWTRAARLMSLPHKVVNERIGVLGLS